MKSKLLIILLALLCIITPVPAAGHSHAAENVNIVTDRVMVPVVMYHNILNHRKSSYIVSARQLDEDITAYKAAGYTTVLPSEVIAYTKGLIPLPKKPLMITFDDGHYNNLYYGFPLLVKHNAKAVINIIGSFSNHSVTSGDHSNPNYSHLTWNQIRELAESGHCEIGNHTYNMHKYKPRYGIAKTYNESDGLYRQNLTNDIQRLQTILQDNCGVTPKIFAYPFGKYTDTGKDVLVSLGFEMLLTCNEGPNYFSVGDTASLLRVNRYNRDGKYSTQEFLNIISRTR